MLREGTLAYGRRVMTALLGVDALYRAETGDLDGLCVLNLDTKGEYPPTSCWWGERVVQEAWERVPRERCSEFLLYLHGRMHSNRTVGMFP